MSTPVTGSFYVTGGTLRQDAPSYVERQADKDLYEGLLHGEFCYVLTSRQMGKSSLMVHTAARLREEGVHVVVLDLTAIGQHLSVEQWYGGLLRRVGLQLDLEDELEEFWLNQPQLGPLERWMTALRRIVLPSVGVQASRRSGVQGGPTCEPERPNARTPERPCRLVLFLDEIDAVRSLPFSTDEFFAGIRECYNRRTQDPEFERLTFCLLGVASPSDLIRDTRMTPFNIGRRIELTDFTEAEAAPLAAGLEFQVFSSSGVQDELHPSPEHRNTRTPEDLLQRILYWTGGHPYLTQRLCQAVAADASVDGPAGVDRQCEALFLSASAREKDDNLLFVRERLLKSEADRASLLDLYGKVRAGRRVGVDDTNPLVDLLRLSGVTRVADGRLKVRNRIYARVFDRHWIVTHMPDAELRRQQAAYRRGLLRATTVASVIVAVVAGLAVTAARQTRLAHRQRLLARQQQRRAEERERTAQKYLYAAQMNLAQQTEEEGNVGPVLEILEAQRPEPGQQDLRGFEWRYLWRRCQGDARATLRGHTESLDAVAFSPDGRLLATGGHDRTVRLWDPAAGREIASLLPATDRPAVVFGLAFSPNGKMLAAAEGGDPNRSDGPGQVRLWDIGSRREVHSLRGHKQAVFAVAFSPDGRMFASGSQDQTVRLWDMNTFRQVGLLQGDCGYWHALAFSPDGKSLMVGGSDGLLRQWDVTTRRRIGAFRGHTAGVITVAFSPDGRILASGSEDNTARVWSTSSRREIAILSGHAGPVNEVAFSPDGKLLATASADSTLKLWDVATHRGRATFRGHNGSVDTAAFSPDGRTLASGGDDMTVKLWNVAARKATGTILQRGVTVGAVAFSPDGKALATAQWDGAVKLWDVAAQRVVASLKGHKARILSLAFSPDGKSLASGSEDHTVKLWTVARASSAGSGSATVRAGQAGNLRSTAEPRPPVAWREVAALPGFQGGPGAVLFSRDGKTLIYQGKAGVNLWDVAAKRVVATLNWKPGNWWLDLSPDGETLAVAGADHTVTLWDLKARRAIGLLVGGAFPSLVFSPDGKTLVTRGQLGSLQLWDVGTRRRLVSLRSRTGSSGLSVFSPDGRNLAGCIGDQISLWNLVAGREVLSLKGHTGPVWALAFSPDGNTLASAGGDGTIRLWQAAALQEADPLRVVLTAASGRAVTLQWKPPPSAVGCYVYRGLEGATRSHLIRLTREPVAGSSFTDTDRGRINGRPLTYAVSALYRGAGPGEVIEGPPVTVQVTPAAPPPGFAGYSIAEGPWFGSLLFDPLSGAITIRGSGRDIWARDDQFYFMSRPVIGDFRVTVQAQSRPSATDVWAKAGLMVREALEPGARDAFLVTTAANGLAWQWRGTANDDSENEEALSNRALKLPITLCLTRRGDTATPSYSRDGGKRFRPAGPPYSFAPPLAKTVYVGLAITAHNASRTSEARFKGLNIEEKR